MASRHRTAASKKEDRVTRAAGFVVVKRSVQLLQKALDETILIPKVHGRRRITKREAIVAGLVDRALQSDPRATRLLLDLMLKTQRDETLNHADPGDAPGARENLIRAFDRIAAKQNWAQAAALGRIEPPANKAPEDKGPAGEAP